MIAKDLKMPEGIAVAFDGDLIVAEVDARRIVRIDPVKGTVTEIAGNLPIGLPAAPGGLPSNIPTGVGIGATGTIYFSSDIENAIYKVTTEVAAEPRSRPARSAGRDPVGFQSI